MDNSTQTKLRNHVELFADLCRQLNKDAAYERIESTNENQSAQNAYLSELPRNAITGKEYRNINAAMLLVATERNGFCSSEWATFKQWSSHKESIRKGEKGTVILRYAAKETTDGNVINSSSMKLFRVFNRTQLKSWHGK